MKKLLLTIVLSIQILFAQTHNVYFMPKQSDEVKNTIVSLIENAKSSIDIAMYNMSYKKFNKALKKAKKAGVNVRIIYEKSDSKLKDLDAIQHKDKAKLHTKMAIFDNKTVVFGSTNWTKESFKDNLEFVYITDDKKIVEQFKEFFERIY